MKVCGIIAEYDPFHKGHAWQLAQAKKESGADFVICAMSMSFTQRGMPALLSSHARAEMALRGGADIVLGVPYAFSVCDAEKFALGGVETLRRTGVVNALSFGIESAGKEVFERAADLLEHPTITYRDLLRSHLDSGISYPRAQGAALAKILHEDANVFSLPNTSLAVCYARAASQTGANLEFVPVERKGTYHSIDSTDNAESFDSASAVREAFQRGDINAVKEALPDSSYRILMNEITKGGIQKYDAFNSLLRWRLRNDDFSHLPDLSEGIENHFCDAANETTRNGMVLRIKSKRYTYARINRLLAHILTQTNAKMIPPLPEYAYLLGFRNSASALLHRISENGMTLYHRIPAGELSPMLDLDRRADDLWALGAAQPFGTLYRAKPVIISDL